MPMNRIAKNNEEPALSAGSSHECSFEFYEDDYRMREGSLKRCRVFLCVCGVERWEWLDNPAFPSA